MPNHHVTPTFPYRVISWLLFPAAFLFTLFVTLKYRDRRYLRERLGLFTLQERRSHSIWCHCASVGEITTALPLFKRLLQQGHTLLISTNTITGRQALQNADLMSATVIFLPLDYASLHKKLLAEYSPAVCLIFETEIWPSLYCITHNNGIPIAIVNGRISDKTLNAPHFLHANYARALKCTRKIFASSQQNAQRFIELGAHADQVSVLDNLKFAQPVNAPSNTTRPLSFPYLLCASTHADEELQIIQQWQQNKPDALGLVIAIRHPQRAGEVCKQIERAGLLFALHSNGGEFHRLDTIYIIDTLGELAPFMASAEIVFMGGSLIPLGGHNVLEPARMGRCTIIGPNYQNFAVIVKELIDADGIKVVRNAGDLMEQTNALLNNAVLRKQLGENARQYALSKQQILDQYADQIEQFIAAHC